MTAACTECGAELGSERWYYDLRTCLCEPCARRMDTCAHESGDQHQRYDADGVGYRVWRCDQCGAESYDPY